MELARGRLSAATARGHEGAGAPPHPFHPVSHRPFQSHLGMHARWGAHASRRSHLRAALEQACQNDSEEELGKPGGTVRPASRERSCRRAFQTGSRPRAAVFPGSANPWSARGRAGRSERARHDSSADRVAPGQLETRAPRPESRVRALSCDGGSALSAPRHPSAVACRGTSGCRPRRAAPRAAPAPRDRRPRPPC